MKKNLISAFLFGSLVATGIFAIQYHKASLSSASPPEVLAVETKNEALDPLRQLNAPEIAALIDGLIIENRLQEAAKLYRYFDCLTVDEYVVQHSNMLLEKMREQKIPIIATTDPAREPQGNEIVIVYGNYHHAHNNLPYTNKIWRHPLYFQEVTHTKVEYHPAWESIGIIYVVGLEERRDRYQEILSELCRMQAPLHRLHYYKAKRESITGNKMVDIYAGATKNHADVTDHFLQSPHQNALILEDDVTFTADLVGNLKRLKLFFDRNYDYEVCLLNSSKYHQIKPFDDLLLSSYQQCTTTSAYLLSRKGAEKALFYFKDGYEKILITGDPNYVCDRYWAQMQKEGKFFLFRTKFGYQRCNYSSITGETACHFD